MAIALGALAVEPLTMRLRCAVVGVGHLGRFHAQKYAMLPDAVLVGVCDLSAERARSVAAELGVAAFVSARDLLGQVDAVTVAASAPAHYALCKLFLENGVHVLVEKPIATDSREAAELCELASRRNLILQVGHSERYNPAFLAVRDTLRKPLFIECQRLAPISSRGADVDVVLDLMIHDLDMILAVIGAEPTLVSAIGAPVLTPRLDIANARIEFKSGAVATATASRISAYAERRWRIVQRDRCVTIDLASGVVDVLDTGERTASEAPIARETQQVEKGDALLDETRDFVGAVIAGRAAPSGVSGREALSTLRLAERIIADAWDRLARAPAP